MGYCGGMISAIGTIFFWMGAVFVAIIVLSIILFVLSLIGEMIDCLLHPPHSSEQSD